MESREAELDLKEIMHIIRKRLWFIVLVTILAVGAGGVISLFVLEPVYRASATIIVGKPSSYLDGNRLQIEDLNLNQRLAKTYGEIIKSRGVLENVIFQLKLNLTTQQLKEKTLVKLVEGTEFITISVTDTNPERAADIANKMAEVFRFKVVNIMKVDYVQILDDAIVPRLPIKPRLELNMAIAGVLGIMTSIFVVFLLEYLDNTIKTPEDAEKYLGLNIVGIIPIM
ncbi:MAG TPA: Wzz/FepE/Etk N-terminal domain-containing protein [Clostridia bacterium]|nr:Wzz/FepE/Etk N-terminal domain-containing protein [Clostridia bacterium]